MLDTLRHILIRLVKPPMTDQAIEWHDLKHASEHLEEGRLDEAMDIVQRAIASNTNNHYFYLLRGLINELQSKYDEAISDFNQVTTLSPEESDSYLSRGRVWNKLSEYGRAVDDFNNAIALSPDADTHLERADAYTQLGEYHAALDDCDRAVTLRPGAEAYIARGTVYHRLQKCQEALSDFNRAALLDQSSTEARVMRGTIYQNQGNYRGAIEEYTQVIALITENTDEDISDLKLLSSEVKSGLYESAILYLGNTFCARGVCRSRTEDYDGALADLDAAAKLIPTNANFYCARGIAYVEMGEHEKAMEELRVAIELEPRSANPLFLRAKLHLDMTRVHEAIADADRAIELNPNWSEPYWIRGWARLHLEEHERALEDFDRAIEVASEHHSSSGPQSGAELTLGSSIVSAVYASRGLVYLLLGNDSNSRDDFKKALELGYSQAEIEEEIAELPLDEQVRETVMSVVRSIATDIRTGVTVQSEELMSRAQTRRHPTDSGRFVAMPVVKERRTLSKDEYARLFRRLGFFNIETGKTLKHRRPIPSLYFNCRYGAVSFVVYTKDEHRFHPNLWDQLPPQKRKDAKHNLMTIVPKNGREREAFEELLS